MSNLLQQIAYVFSNSKTIERPRANKLGLQLARTTLARMVYRSRVPHTPLSVREEVRTLQREGLLIIPNFLPQPTFKHVAGRAAALWDREQSRIHKVPNGPNTLHVLSRREVPLAKDLPEFFTHPRLCAILESAERRRGVFERAYQAVELLVQGPISGHDPETDLHSDTFYTIHKVWLYLSDVTLDSPPLVYVKRSHFLSTTLLAGVYRESCASNIGSRRITPQEFETMQLEETVVTCPRNTLVIANTFGYHRRLAGKPGQTRFALHVALRDGTPFRWSL